MASDVKTTEEKMVTSLDIDTVTCAIKAIGDLMSIHITTKNNSSKSGFDVTDEHTGSVWTKKEMEYLKLRAINLLELLPFVEFQNGGDSEASL